MADPQFLQPFVLCLPEVRPRRKGRIDIYVPKENEREPRPAIVFVHGGPLPPELRPTPRDWPVYVGYGSLAASRGMVGVTVDHRLHAPANYSIAADDVSRAVAQARALPEIDPTMVAL